MVRVSVVIPTYNYGHFLGEAIQSVLDQTFQDFEIIVVDDGSTDNTREVITGFKDPRIRYIYQDNAGVSAAQNTGIKASKTEYITILGADDLYLPQNIEIKVKLLDSRSDIGLVCSDVYLINDSTGAILRRFWHNTNGSHPWFDLERATRQPLKELLSKECFIGPQAAMIRNEVFATVGYFDESLPTYEDWDLFVRIVQRFPIAIIDMPLLKARRHNTSLSQNQEKMHLGAMAAFNKVMRSGSLSKEELKLLKERLLLEHFHYWWPALLSGREAASRKAMFAAIRLKPWNIKLYFYFVLSFLGTKKIQALRNWRKSLGHFSAGSQPAGGT